MDVAALLDAIRHHRLYDGQIAHCRELPEREGQFAEPDRPLPPVLRDLLRARGIERLYRHQVMALDTARGGLDLVVVTGTASGKTLCYNLPILETCLADPDARALYLFPTKALAQDQFKGLLEWCAGEPAVVEGIRPGVYDGDTPTAQRRRIKAEANLVLSNPDMLHASILPYHPKWHRFLSQLRYVVLDEVHTYRGIFGAHVACVLKRLLRVCRHYGSDPVFLAASATIANPGELTGRLIGRAVQVIDCDGAPRGKKYFVLWNPSPAGKDRLARRSAADDAVWLMAETMDAEGQALAFTRTRQAAELLHRYTQDALRERRSPWVDAVRAYRGGYLPNERRQIEQDLFAGRLRGVAATNALELGVDIGSLDVTLLVNYPGTIASTWQQAGRSGRRHAESLAVLMAGNDPVDQYLLRHPDYFFAQTPEQAVVDPENTYVLARHLQAAAFELPLAPEDCAVFGPRAAPVARVLCESGELSEVAGKAYYVGAENPAHRISLRHMSDETFSIVLCRPKQEPPLAPVEFPAGRPRRGDGPADLGTRRQAMASEHEVIANVDAISAPELIYPQAVYLHNGETYFIRRLDLDHRVAYAERHEMNYYTQAVLDSHVQILRQRADSQLLSTTQLGFGDVDVRLQTVAFKKIKFGTRENIGYGQVDIPAQNLETTALWLFPGEDIRAALKAEGLRVSEGLCGIRNLAVEALPMIAMCDSRDISGVVDSKNLGRSTMILYDRYPGGLGYCEQGFHRILELLHLCEQIVGECECEDGCPSCVGLPNLRPAIHSDPDLTRGYPIPSKAAAKRLLHLLLGRQGVGSHGAQVEHAT